MLHLVVAGVAHAVSDLVRSPEPFRRKRGERLQRLGCRAMGDCQSAPMPRGMERLSATQGIVAARFVDFPYAAPKPKGCTCWTRFVCFSDTHGLHDQIPAGHQPLGDVLLHAGDFSNTGEPSQVESFARWLGRYPAAQKVVIAGNHDVTFHPEYYTRNYGRYHHKPFDCLATRRSLIESGCCTYLEDTGLEIFGYRIYGSPWQPEFCNWAFNLPLGEQCRQMWERIPAYVDILITHGPPHGIGDKCSNGAHAGCPDLLQAIRDRRCAISLAGHVHGGYGVVKDEALGIAFVNASTCTSDYRPDQPPIVFDLPPPAELRARRAAAAGSDLSAGVVNGNARAFLV